jgi:AraC-like ligand binding domain
MARTDKNNVTRYWWDSHIPGLSLMSADFTSHDYATHTHDAFVIAISELGSAKIKSRGTVETVHSTRLFVSNPEEPQSSSMAGSTRWRYRSIYLTSAGIVAVAHGLGIEEVPYFTKNVIDDSNLVSCFGSLHRAFEAGADPFLRHELLICACERLFRGHGSAAVRMKSAPATGRLRAKRSSSSMLASPKRCSSASLRLRRECLCFSLSAYSGEPLERRRMYI